MNFCVDSLLEIWIHYFTSKTKEQSKQWILSGEPAPKKTKIVKSAGKVMATVFWDARGIIHIDYLPSKQTINDDYYAALLDHFNNILKKKTSPFGKEKSALPSRQCTGSHVPMAKFRYELLPHPYSPDLAFCDYSCFSNEENVRRKEIHYQRVAHHRNRGLF